MKYLLSMHLNPAVMAALSDEERNELQTGHGDFIAKIKESGEYVFTQALADPSASTVIRAYDGVPAVTDGPYIESKEFLGGFYVVDCKTRERAHEVAAMLPDAKIKGLGIEVREVIFSDGLPE